VPREVRELVDATRRGMEAGIAAAVAGNRLGDIGHAIESVAHERGYGIVRPFVGHGIGRAMHEDPQVPNYGRPGTGLLIEPGMCFAIEPMFNLGGDDVYVDDDGWTVRTVDAALSAHFENTIAVTDAGPIVLTEHS
jgi:methionyl aminopeptidase